MKKETQLFLEEEDWNTFKNIKEEFYNSNLPFKVDIKTLKEFDSSFLKLIQKDLLLLKTSGHHCV